MQNRRADPLSPGALGWGQARASKASNVLYVVTQFTPIDGAIIADKRVGRYRLLCLTVRIYLLGAATLFVFSLTAVIDAGVTPAIFITSLFLIAVGISGANGALAALVGGQFTREDGEIGAAEKGERAEHLERCQRLWRRIEHCHQSHIQ
ncbi:Oligopeptide transporter [Macrophomina phaseolina MS6]|uniref:Oligopeptide transporter n=1 Tax=Macrophomina phaseolina (strain MS6) TaxID=1126212 RepID=K2RZ46_MACPH|nr:Oligopeptide transporter [Macrophomina phaseolina MS6]